MSVIVGYLNGLPIWGFTEEEKKQAEIDEAVAACHARIHKVKYRELSKQANRVVVSFRNGKVFIIERKLLTENKRAWRFRWLLRDLVKEVTTQLLGFDEYGVELREKAKPDC